MESPTDGPFELSAGRQLCYRLTSTPPRLDVKRTASRLGLDNRKLAQSTMDEPNRKSNHRVATSVVPS
jgi:hypothetical protein